MIGIIAAMDVETDAFKELMEDVKEVETGVFQGLLEGKKVTLLRSGVGKVAATITTTSLIEKYHPELVINIGSAGSLQSNIRVGSVVIASEVAHHDVEVPGWPKGFGQEKTCYPADENWLKKAQETKSDLKIYYGPMVSGDSFIYQKSQTEKIVKEFPEALCVEMEAVAIAQTCTRYQIPFLILRSISDVAIEDGNEVEFDQFVKVAAKNSANFTRDFIKGLSL